MAEAPALGFVCTQTECTVSETGRCMDGLEPPDCPNSSPAGEAPPKAESTTDTAPDEREASGSEDAPPGLPIHSGEALDPIEARVITRCFPTTVVLVMGEVKCGKTTLLGSLYERIRLGRVEKFRFRGSRTLIGFERRYFSSRTSSRRRNPHTRRTGTKEAGFLHLDLVKPEASSRHQLLLADVSGEAFRSLRDTPRDLTEVPSLPRANVLALVLDGAKLADAGERYVELDQIQLLGRGLLEKAQITSAVVIQLVVAKWDRIRDAGQEKDRKADIEELRGFFESYDLPTELYYTECRGNQWGTGLDVVLESWAGHPSEPPQQLPEPTSRWSLPRAYHRFPTEAEPPWL